MMLKSFKIIEARAHMLQYGVRTLCYLEYTIIVCLPTIKSLVRVHPSKKSCPPPGVIEKQQGDTIKE